MRSTCGAARVERRDLGREIRTTAHGGLDQLIHLAAQSGRNRQAVETRHVERSVGGDSQRDGHVRLRFAHQQMRAGEIVLRLRDALAREQQLGLGGQSEIDAAADGLVVGLRELDVFFSSLHRGLRRADRIERALRREHHILQLAVEREVRGCELRTRGGCAGVAAAEVEQRVGELDHRSYLPLLEHRVLPGQLEYFALVSTRNLRTHDRIVRRARDSVGRGAARA